MRTIALGALLGTWPRAATAETPLYDESFAVVVGIDAYATPAWPHLGYAVADAKAMAALLEARGFAVTPLYDGAATKQAILSAMQGDLARRVGEGDRVVVFFAGHGFTETLAGRDWGYVVPHDANQDSASFLSMEELRAQSAKMGAATHQLFIMDTCYGGALGTRGISPIDPTVPGYLHEITSRPARLILTAGGKNQAVADGGPRGHSVFTGYLLEALEEGLGDLNRDGYITFSELEAYLVPRATTELQTPASGVLPEHGLGDFVFRAPRTPAASKPGDAGPGGPSRGPSTDGYGGHTGLAAAQQLVSDWLAASMDADVARMLAVSDYPFYFDNEVILRPPDLQARLVAMFGGTPPPTQGAQILRIVADTLGGRRAGGGLSGDRVLQSLFLVDEDYVVDVEIRDPGTGRVDGVRFFARRTGSGLKLVALWG